MGTVVICGGILVGILIGLLIADLVRWLAKKRG